MPKNLTTYTKAARSGILELLKTHPEDKPLPSLRQLAEEFDLHPTTMFRVLHDLEAEGTVWQGPSRRFFPASARSHKLKGAPVCFIGRNIQDWSQLYQEILAGVTEVCTVNSSPIILHTAPSLVQVPVFLEEALFASPAEQTAELKKLISTVPKGCAGFILDHLWTDVALNSVNFPAGEKIQLLLGSGKHAKVLKPNYLAGVKIIRDYIESKSYDEIYLVVTEMKEPLFDHCMNQLRKGLSEFKTKDVSFYDHDTLREIAARASDHTCFICPEDNISVALAKTLSELHPPSDDHRIEVLAIQGTGVVTSPHTRLRYDYRRLGRSAASSILHGTAIKQMSPRLVAHTDDDES